MNLWEPLPQVVLPAGAHRPSGVDSPGDMRARVMTHHFAWAYSQRRRAEQEQTPARR